MKIEGLIILRRLLRCKLSEQMKTVILDRVPHDARSVLEETIYCYKSEPHGTDKSNFSNHVVGYRPIPEIFQLKQVPVYLSACDHKAICQMTIDHGQWRYFLTRPFACRFQITNVRRVVRLAACVSHIRNSLFESCKEFLHALYLRPYVTCGELCQFHFVSLAPTRLRCGKPDRSKESSDGSGRACPRAFIPGLKLGPQPNHRAYEDYNGPGCQYQQARRTSVCVTARHKFHCQKKV